MVGQILYRREKGKEKPSRRDYGWFQVPAATLFDPPGLSDRRLEKRLERLERLLCAAGVDRVILPDDFPYREKLRRVRPVSPLPLYRAAADLLVLGLLEKRGIPPLRSRVALSAPGPCRELTCAAYRLCASVREVRIDIPGETGERLRRQLQEHFGVPVIPPGLPADVTLSFGGAAGDLRLCGERPELAGLRLRAEGIDLPEGSQQLLTLLWERGFIRREALRVLPAQIFCKNT